MNVEQVLNEFKKSGALLEGHFILSSGLHSDKFLQKALVFQDAKRTAKLCKALAAKVKREVGEEITAIVSPAARAQETFRYLEVEGAAYIINVRHVVELAEETFS